MMEFNIHAHKKPKSFNTPLQSNRKLLSFVRQGKYFADMLVSWPLISPSLREVLFRSLAHKTIFFFLVLTQFLGKFNII